MAFTLADIKKRAAEAAKKGPDYNEQKSGGGDYVPPAEGHTRLRLVAYIETGLKTTVSPQFGAKTKKRAVLVFELSGKKHEPKKLEDGRLIPHLIEIKEAIGQNKKSNFSKLFKEMVKEHPGAKNFGELVGQAFTGKVVHRKYKRRDGTDGVSAELKGENGYTITGVTYEDPESETVKKYAVGDPISPLRLFLWDFADLEQWDSLFIDGKYDNGDSKNKYQELIKQAEDLDGSPIYQALIEAGREEELVPAPKATKEGETAPQDGASDEPDGDDDGPAEEPEKEPVKEAPAKASKTAQAAPKSAAKGKGAATEKTAPKAAKAAAKAKPAQPEDDNDDPLAGLDD